MQKIHAHSTAPSVQDNPQTHTDLEIMKLLQRAATGLSDALELVFEDGFDKCNVFTVAFASRADKLFQDDVSRLVMEMTVSGMTLQ